MGMSGAVLRHRVIGSAQQREAYAYFRRDRIHAVLYDVRWRLRSQREAFDAGPRHALPFLRPDQSRGRVELPCGMGADAEGDGQALRHGSSGLLATNRRPENIRTQVISRDLAARLFFNLQAALSGYALAAAPSTDGWRLDSKGVSQRFLASEDFNCSIEGFGSHGRI